ncbi:MAG: V-type ATP synthase subunit D [Gammaproteobacteria bacterium]|jgi:V/A-type H+/Na+-transporting ATPase subunit D
MSRRLQLPPTRSTLLEVRRQLVFLEQGYRLLDRKRELLTRLMYDRLGNYRKLREQVDSQLKDAYQWLAITQMRMGSRQLHQAAVGLSASMKVHILPRSSLGVQYPSVTVKRLALQPVSLLWSDSSFDEARLRMAELALSLARLGESEMALRRVTREQRKTQKRVNALRYNVIPSYRETIRNIENVLEEEERNALFQNKLLKKRREKATD